MNYRTAALVGLRLLAIWLIVLGISVLPQLADLWRGSVSAKDLAMERWFQLGYTLMVIAPFILGIVLWVISRWLSRFLAPAVAGALPITAPPMLIQGAIAIAGLVIAVTSLPGLIYTIVSVVADIDYPSAIGLETWARLAVQIVLVLLGLGLVIGSRRLRDGISRVRTFNT